MVFNASILDWLALVLFFAAVVAYSRYADHVGDRLLNARMREVRAIWMRRYLEREDRVLDSILTGHSINSIALFSSATLLIVVALLGVLTNADTAYYVAITWALLQYNYFLALVGSAPLRDHLTPTATAALGNQMSVVLNSAVTSFHSGFRSYYQALAWVGWFFHPLVFIAATAFVTFVLVYRQISSPSAGAIKGYAALLREIEEQTRK